MSAGAAIACGEVVDSDSERIRPNSAQEDVSGPPQPVQEKKATWFFHDVSSSDKVSAGPANLEMPMSARTAYPSTEELDCKSEASSEHEDMCRQSVPAKQKKATWFFGPQVKPTDSHPHESDPSEDQPSTNAIESGGKFFSKQSDSQDYEENIIEALRSPRTESMHANHIPPLLGREIGGTETDGHTLSAHSRSEENDGHDVWTQDSMPTIDALTAPATINFLSPLLGREVGFVEVTATENHSRVGVPAARHAADAEEATSIHDDATGGQEEVAQNGTIASSTEQARAAGQSLPLSISVEISPSSATSEGGSVWRHGLFPDPYTPGTSTSSAGMPQRFTPELTPETIHYSSVRHREQDDDIAAVSPIPSPRNKSAAPFPAAAAACGDEDDDGGSGGEGGASPTVKNIVKVGDKHPLGGSCRVATQRWLREEAAPSMPRGVGGGAQWACGRGVVAVCMRQSYAGSLVRM